MQGLGKRNLTEQVEQIEGWTNLPHWGWNSRFTAALDLLCQEWPGCCCWMDTVSLYHLQPSTSLQLLTALPCSFTQSYCGIGSIPGCLGPEGVWQAPNDSKEASEQVGTAAGEQSQTAGRWMEQQGGNTRQAAGGEGSRRATPLCTQLDINYTCWNPVRLLRPFFRC